MADVATNILNYRPNTNLVSSVGISEPDLTPLTQTARDFMYYAYDAQKTLFNQRIKDRDTLFNLINDDQLVLNEVLERDKPQIRKAIEDFQNIYFKNGEKVLQDPKTYSEFISKKQKALELIKDAQKKYAAIKTEISALSQEQSVYDYNKRLEHIKKMYEAPLGEIPLPYVNLIPFDIKVVQSDPVFSSEPSKDGLYTITKINPFATYEKYRNNWFQQQYRNQFNEFLKRVNDLPNPLEWLDTINKKIEEFNKKTGYKVEPLQLVQTSDGWQFTDPEYVAAAKIRIADDPNPVSTQFNKDVGTYKIDLGQLGVQRGQLEVQRMRAATEAKLARANKIDGVYGANAILNAMKEAIDAGTPVGGNNNLVSIGMPDFLKKFGTVTSDGTVKDAADDLQFDKNKGVYYLVWNAKQDPLTGKTTPEKRIAISQRELANEYVRSRFENKDVSDVLIQVDDKLSKLGNILNWQVNNSDVSTNVTQTTSNNVIDKNSTYTYLGKEYTYDQLKKQLNIQSDNDLANYINMGLIQKK